MNILRWIWRKFIRVVVFVMVLQLVYLIAIKADQSLVPEAQLAVAESRQIPKEEENAYAFIVKTLKQQESERGQERVSRTGAAEFEIGDSYAFCMSSEDVYEYCKAACCWSDAEIESVYEANKWLSDLAYSSFDYPGYHAAYDIYYNSWFLSLGWAIVVDVHREIRAQRYKDAYSKLIIGLEFSQRIYSTPNGITMLMALLTDGALLRTLAELVSLARPSDEDLLRLEALLKPLSVKSIMHQHMLSLLLGVDYWREQVASRKQEEVDRTDPISLPLFGTWEPDFVFKPGLTMNQIVSKFQAIPIGLNILCGPDESGSETWDEPWYDFTDYNWVGRSIYDFSRPTEIARSLSVHNGVRQMVWTRIMLDREINAEQIARVEKEFEIPQRYTGKSVQWSAQTRELSITLGEHENCKERLWVGE